MAIPADVALQIPDTPDSGVPSVVTSAIGLIVSVVLIALIVIALYRWVWPPVADVVRYDREDRELRSLRARLPVQ